MKTFPLIAVALLIACASYAQSSMTLSSSGTGSTSAAPAKPQANYLVRVDWLAPKGSESKYLEVLTTDGSFSLDTIQKNPVKINNSDIPVTLRMQGTLNVINDDKARLQLFLGRTVPYVTSTMKDGTSSYSQLSVGLSSNFIVTYGKPVIIQNDENGQVAVLVKRVD
jgi:hypothetical protein